MLYGHRKDVEGFARSLEEFDVQLTLSVVAEASDLLMIQRIMDAIRIRAGNDDHSRELHIKLFERPCEAFHILTMAYSMSKSTRLQKSADDRSCTARSVSPFHLCSISS